MPKILIGEWSWLNWFKRVNYYYDGTVFGRELLADLITISDLSDLLDWNRRLELLCVWSLRGKGNSYI